MRSVATDQASARTTTTLIVGWGNELLGDDAAGRRVAEEMEARRIPGVQVLERHQLTPELALPISSADRVYFVDAFPAEENDRLRMSRLAPARAVSAAPNTHTGRPEDLLSMALSLYGRCAEAWLVAVPAFRFESGSELSTTTRKGIRDAVDRLEESIVRKGAPCEN